MKYLVFTEQSLLAFIENLTEEKIKTGIFKDDKNYFCYETDIFSVFLTTNKKDSYIENLPFIIFDKSIDFSEMDIVNIQKVFYTVHKTVCQVLQYKGTGFSSPSVLYRNKNLLSLKAFDNKHLFMAINYNNTKNFQIIKLAEQNEAIEDIIVDGKICNTIDVCRDQIKKQYNEYLEQNEIQEFNFNYNLNTVYDDEKQVFYTYDQWVNILSRRQRAFLDNDDTRALKLSGPAGTGKTLVMELKAIKILKNNPEARVLFTCHSWAVACQVSDFIDSVSPEFSNKITIAPLLELAKEHVGVRNKDIIMLGNDSYEGKYDQIMILSDLIQDFLDTDWVVYKNQCSAEFVELLEGVNFTSNNFTWDIMTEISCVIGANGIMPGNNSFEKYKRIARRNWMMHLENETEKKVIFEIYEKYMNYLIKNKNISSDQIINDYINYLSMYNWFYERKTEGFDYIFVDEMQLFNDQERMALVYLSRKTDDYPKIIMALDPRQSVDEVYSDLGITDIMNKANPETDKSIGKTTSYNLDVAYRYTKEILKFLQHVNAFYPQMDLGHDWDNKISGLKASRMKQGVLPKLYTLQSIDEEIKNAVSYAEELTKSGKQTIILSLQEDIFNGLKEKYQNNSKLEFILSKKDIALLKYSKKKILISEPNYVIGLQFDAVILCGCYSIYAKYEKNKSYYLRRFLSDLYLGASRAITDLILTRNITMADSLEFLEKAIEDNIIETCN